MQEQETDKDGQKKDRGPGWYSCLIWGMLVGIIFGAALRNVGLGLSLGLLFGYTYWIFNDRKKKDK